MEVVFLGILEGWDRNSAWSARSKADTGSREGCRAAESKARQGCYLTDYNTHSGPGSGHTESIKSHVNSTGQYLLRRHGPCRTRGYGMGHQETSSIPGGGILPALQSIKVAIQVGCCRKGQDMQLIPLNGLAQNANQSVCPLGICRLSPSTT